MTRERCAFQRMTEVGARSSGVGTSATVRSVARRMVWMALHDWIAGGQRDVIWDAAEDKS